MANCGTCIHGHVCMFRKLLDKFTESGASFEAEYLSDCQYYIRDDGLIPGVEAERDDYIVHDCVTCRYSFISLNETPCNTCTLSDGSDYYSNWEVKDG